MAAQRPTGNGNALRDYRIGKLEEIAEGHDTRIRLVEDFIIKSSSSDSVARYLKVGVVILAGLGTLIGGVYSILR